MTSTADPYEFSLSGASRYQSTQQSRNTPVSSVSSAGGQPQAVSWAENQFVTLTFCLGGWGKDKRTKLIIQLSYTDRSALPVLCHC